MEHDRWPDKISRATLPHLRYGARKFDLLTDPHGIVPIRRLLNMERFQELNTSRNRTIAILTHEKAIPSPRFEANRYLSIIRPTSKNPRIYSWGNEANPRVSPSIPKPSVLRGNTSLLLNTNVPCVLEPEESDALVTPPANNLDMAIPKMIPTVLHKPNMPLSHREQASAYPLHLRKQPRRNSPPPPHPHSPPSYGLDFSAFEVAFRDVVLARKQDRANPRPDPQTRTVPCVGSLFKKNPINRDISIKNTFSPPPILIPVKIYVPPIPSLWVNRRRYCFLF